MSVTKVIELVGTSKEGWGDAAQQAVREASASLRKINGVDLVHQAARVEGGKIVEFRSTVRVSFEVEHHSHLVGAGTAART